MFLAKLYSKLCGWDCVHNKTPILRASDILQYQNDLLNGFRKSTCELLASKILVENFVSPYQSFHEYLSVYSRIIKTISQNDYIDSSDKVLFTATHFQKTLSLDDFIVDQYNVPYSIDNLIKTLYKQNNGLLIALSIQSPKSDYYQSQLAPFLQVGAKLTEALVSIAIKRCEASYWISLDLLLKRFIEQPVCSVSSGVNYLTKEE